MGGILGRGGLRSSYDFQIDISRMSRLSASEQVLVQQIARNFLDGVHNIFAEMYLKLDVEEQKEKTRQVPRFAWRALLITDRGRYYADDVGFGVEESLKNALDALEFQIRSRIGKSDSRKPVYWN